ncbi:MAG: DUF2062 domain-containing protein [Fibrobacterota bacterium]|nr:DUF2062 domain-containing protein [Fibrobacterota bacterium]
MHGGFLHRLLGEGIFDKRLWKPERSTLAAGMAIGLFVGLLPTYWVQFIIAAFLAFLFKVNLTSAVLGTLITNPFTTLPIVGLQYKIGVWLIGPPVPHEFEKYHGFVKVVLKAVFSHGKPYLVGSVITAVIAAILGYIAVLIFWQAGTKVKEVREKHREHQEHQEHQEHHPD